MLFFIGKSHSWQAQSRYLTFSDDMICSIRFGIIMNQNRVTEPVRLLVERARREMNLNGSLRFDPGGKCSEGGATTLTLPHWDHFQLIPRQFRQRKHTVRWTYFYWVQQDNRLYCRQKDFRLTSEKEKLDTEDERRILAHFQGTPFDLLWIGGGGKFKGQWELKRLRRPTAE